MKMKRIVSSALMGILLVTTGSIALAEEKDEKDLSAYQWGYWDKMVSPAAGPLAPVGVVVSAPLPPPPIPEPTLIPASDPDPIPEPEPIKLIPGWDRDDSPVTRDVTVPIIPGWDRDDSPVTRDVTVPINNNAGINNDGGGDSPPPLPLQPPF